MILTKRDLGEFESALEKCYSRRRLQQNEFGAYFVGHERDLQFTAWLAQHPQVLMAGARLQEFVGAHTLPIYRTLVQQSAILGATRPAFRDFSGQWLMAAGKRGGEFLGYSLAGLGRAVQLGVGHDDYDDALDESLVVIAGSDDVLKRAYLHVDNPLSDSVTFISPALWTPTSQESEKALLQGAARPLIQALQSDGCDLRTLHWRELEHIVAEVLRASGMEIHQVRDSPQGGRDIIARSHVIPGELVTIAVEVKHRSIVGRPALHTALHQNAMFPAIMLVTSGRFTAGVIREAEKPENRMRIFLKDGVAIRDMIRGYRL